jgi:hypothetical protein
LSDDARLVLVAVLLTVCVSAAEVDVVLLPSPL